MENRQLVPAADLALAQVQRQIAGQLADTSKRVYAANIRAFLAFVGDKPIWQIRREEITAYRDHLLHTCRSRRTAQSRFAIVMRLFHEAMATPEIANLFPGGVSPVARLRGIKVSDSAASSKHRRIDSGAIRSILEKLNQRDALIVKFLLYTGIRRAELHKLKVKDIETAGAYWKATIQGKGAKTREIGIPPHLIEDVQAYLATRPAHTPESPLFPALRPNPNSRDHWQAEVTPLSADMIYQIVRRAGRLVGIENLTAHSTRVTFVTTALEADVPIQDVAIHVGHASIQQTMTYYKSDRIVKDSPAYKVRY